MAENRFDDLFAEADAAFTGKYQKELNELSGLSKDQLEAVTPGTTNAEAYSALIAVVKKASQDNLSQAQLIGNIKALGEVCIKIASKIPAFAALL